ncbi:adenylate kinase [Metamycoplasma cloacale]|uniref:Adenylate kinase n=1 Tax=Metamycoplasma cloacale TaxID=92401 RepID=A0A2Z4LN83_9BACT|nr:adenylate kinase [Metamycoplasma cloacale]AWX42717.1 adenylate kinase [Metamycoplasma cloacale]VEU79471.1 adenylate kinase [Metamycoplasma cloacale]
MIAKCQKNKSCCNSNENQYPNIIFLGAPGAGKGSIATRIVKVYGYYQLSTGEMFREEIANKTPLGLEIKSILDSGKYVDDSLTNRLVEAKVSELVKQKQPFILDGYPRTLEQANFLKSLESKGINIGKVILLNITSDQVIERLSKRRICSECKKIYHLEFNPPKDENVCDKCGGAIIKRLDDEPEVIKKRLAIYSEQTKCLIDYYNDMKILSEVNGYQEYEKVYSDVQKALKWS